MVMRREGSVEVMLGKVMLGGRQFCLEFRMLVCPLVKREASARGMGMDVVTRAEGRLGLCFLGLGLVGGNSFPWG